MARVEVTKEKKSPRATELSRLKAELKRAPSSSKLASATSPKLPSSRRPQANSPRHCRLSDRIAAGA